ncbi:hypothetical protein P5491_020740 [Priestia megaterium]|uniref:hypothetical protein n=1 Tax=Priestia megaterium TaxID=1404 RepID=UPI00245318B0|nr:hypothetical protein [Priestia megaterium]MDH3140449.1 hypothetical protein [Priestia megaterium]
MEIRHVMSDEGRYKVEILEEIIFSRPNHRFFLQYFNQLKKDGHILASSFDNMEWGLLCPTQHKEIKFEFSLPFANFILPLKTFVTLRRLSGARPRTIKEELTFLKKIIVHTDGLKSKRKIKEYFIRPVTDVLYRRALTLANFLNYYLMEDIKDTIIECLNHMRKPIRNNRELPVFTDVLIFDEYTNKYFQTRSIKESFQYYPIYLWWTITNIIPLRSIDFVHIKKDCLEIKSDNSCWITVPRFKMNSNSLDETYWEQQLIIDNKTYMIIKQYLSELHRRGIESKYLIPDLEHINGKFRGGYKIIENISTNQQLNLLITFFYKEVIEGIYGSYELDRITVGDTRHFAIINMFLQGFNVLTIARMAGHEEIRSPSNYYTHAKHFLNSFVYKLVQNKLEGDIGINMQDGFLGTKGHQVYKARVMPLKKEMRDKYKRVEYGYCSDTEDFPNNCVQDCRLCEHYEFYPSVNEWKEAIKWLESYSKDIQIEIDKTLNFMFMISMKTYNELGQINKLEDDELKFKSIQLFKYLDHKAIIDARLLEERYDEEGK